MLIIDDALFFPISSILWIFRKVHDVAQQELAAEAKTITAELSELYRMLETGKISNAEFDTQEKHLLDRLDEIEERTVAIKDEEE